MDGELERRTDSALSTAVALRKKVFENRELSVRVKMKVMQLKQGMCLISLLLRSMFLLLTITSRYTVH